MALLKYYLPEDAHLYSKETHRKPEKVSIKLMDSVGIDIDQQLTSPLESRFEKELDLVITSSPEAKNLYDSTPEWQHIPVHHLEEDVNDELSGKELKKSLKQSRKRIQKFCDQLLEEVK